MAEEEPTPQPETKTVQTPVEQEEFLVAEWTEAPHQSDPFSPQIRLRIIAGALVLTATFILLGIWLKQLNFYFAAAVVLAALAAVFQQNKHGEPQLEVIITTARVQIGKKIISLSDLTGFWVATDRDSLVLYFESKRPSVIPISCFYSSNNLEEARENLLQVLPELEPRAKHYTDRFSDYFKF